MAVERAAILDVLAESKKPLGLGELLTRLGLNPGQRTELKRELRELVRAGDIVKDGKRYDLPAKARESAPLAPELPIQEFATTAPPLIGSRTGRRGRFIIGTLNKHPDGFGFVRPLSGGTADYYLPASDASRAIDGDLVRIQIVPGYKGKPSARLLDVVERRRTRALGTYVRRGEACYVTPTERSLGDAILVPRSRAAKDGDLVKVAITSPPTPTTPPGGFVLEVVDRDDPQAEALEAAYENGFSETFPRDVLEEAEKVPLDIDEREIARRRDLRPLRLVTIDGEEARDFDDSVFVERVGAGYRLVVAIADVAHYVAAGSAMDHEALRRGTSVYFPNMALPMLPQRLSNGICSLKPGEDRLCLVADMVFEREGARVRRADAQIYEGVMRSAARCTYPEVAAVLGGEQVPHRELLRADLELMAELTELLAATREARGSIDFNLPEAKVVLDERNRPVRIDKRPRNIAHRIIEELMLAANEQVARYFSARGLPTVYRVHGAPDEEKLETFLALARAHGFALEAGEEISGRSLNALLKRIAGSPEQRTLNFLLLRAMMQAIYSAENIGHFGLAAPFYLHFTSPIRRYPDLMVHRLLKEHWARGARSLSEGELADLEERLDGISARCSERERAAMSAERDVQSFFMALYMADKIGQELDGHVSAVTDFGFFVELADVFVEGLVKTETVGPGGELDVERHRIVFPSGLSFGLGTPVRVRVVGVNPKRRHIDFQLLEVRGQRPGAGGKGRRGKRAQAAEAKPPAEPRPRGRKPAGQAADGRAGKRKPGGRSIEAAPTTEGTARKERQVRKAKPAARKAKRER
ncbi:MAG: ribonuclease R [Myxococcales bacterium]|jgi:ribonuclease R